MRARIPRILGCGGKNHTGAATAQACVSMGDRGGGMAVPLRMIAGVLIMIAVLSTAAPVRVAAQQPYILAAEDVIEVVVFGNADVSRTVTIRPDGMISLPLIGEVAAAGLSPERLRRQLTQLFTTYFRTPQVAVIVREFHKVRVAVLGQVTRPGVYELMQGATVLDALAAAQGLAVDAGLGEARLMRGGDPPVVIDLERLLLRGELALNLPLLPGDALVIPEDPTGRVYVLGEVLRPGIVPLRGSLTALQAMTPAGGPTRRALLNRAHIIRRGRQAPAAATVTLATVTVAKQSIAGVQLLPVDLLKVIREGDVARDLALQRGDVLYIPENPIALENIGLLIGIAANVSYLLR